MANEKLTALSAITAPSSDDLLYIVDDPGGTPVSKKITSLDLLGLLYSAGEISITGTATATIGRMHVCTGTSAAYTVTLPAASGNTGKLIGFRMGSLAALTKLVTLDGNGSETIDGSLTRVMWAQETAILYCDGSNWFKIAGRAKPMSAAMYLSTLQQPISNNTATKVLLDASADDPTGTMVDTTNKRVNITRPSVYLVFGQTVHTTTAGNAGITANRVITIITRNGAQITTSEAPGTTTFVGLLAQSLLSYVATDNIELYGYSNTGGNTGFYGAGSLAGGGCQMSVLEIPQW